MGAVVLSHDTPPCGDEAAARMGHPVCRWFVLGVELFG
jgi:hypothetical protein